MKTLTAILLSLLAATSLAGEFSAEPIDAGTNFVLTTTRPAEGAGGVRCRWTVYKDGQPAASGQWPLDGLCAGRPLTNAAPHALREMRRRGGDLAVRVRFVTGETDPRKETLLDQRQFEFPRGKVRTLPAYVGSPAVLATTAETYEFKTPSTRIRFDRGTGLLSGFATGWWSLTEWLKRPMAFDFGDPAPGIRLETFTSPVETNGLWSFRTVSWWTMSGPKAEKSNFELRVTTDWQVRGDGRVVSRTAIRPFGLRHILPRVGWAFVLAPPDPLVQYYGVGPAAVPLEPEKAGADRFLAGVAGLYSATVAGCGNHEEARAVSFDAGSDHFALSTLGDNFALEIGPTASKATFCGLVAERKTETDHDWKLDILISPEKVLQAMALPEAGDR